MYEGSLGTVSNREDWEQIVEIVDENDDEIDISSAEIVVAVRAPDTSAPKLTADNSDGITISSPQFSFLFDVDQMRSLCPGQYDVGMTLTVNSMVFQLFIGTVNIVDGIVS